MSENFLEQAEQAELFRQKQVDNSRLIFNTDGSAGRNSVKLAQICTIWDFTMNILGWQNKPLANLTTFLTQYQASIDGKYHNDFKDIKIAEEVEHRRTERKGFSIIQQ